MKKPIHYLFLFVFLLGMSESKANPMPTIPTELEVLFNAATRAEVKVDTLPQVKESNCLKEYAPIPVGEAKYIRVGNEVYRIKDWFCIPDETERNFVGFRINAVHESFLSRISLEVTDQGLALIENKTRYPARSNQN